MNIDVIVADKVATTVGSPVIVCGNSDYIVAFSFDSEWDEYTAKTARFSFIRDGQLKYIDVPFVGNTCNAPVLSGIRRVGVGVYAGELHTTTGAVIECRKSILCEGGEQEPPSESVYNEIMRLFNQKYVDTSLTPVEHEYNPESEAPISSKGVEQALNVFVDTELRAELEEAIGVVTVEAEEIELGFYSNCYYSMSSTDYADGDGKISKSGARCTELTQVTEGQKFFVSGRCLGDTALIAEFDENQNFIKGVGSGDVNADHNIAIDYEYTVPNGVAYVAFSTYSNVAAPLIVKVPVQAYTKFRNVGDELDDLKGTVSYLKDTELPSCRNDIFVLEQDVTGLKEDISNLKEDVSSVGVVEHEYNPESENPISGKGVAQALVGFTGGGETPENIETIANKLDLINNQINGTVDLSEITWEIGTVTNGANATSKSRIRSNEIEFDENISIQIFGNNKFYVHFFKDGTFITGKSVGWVKEVKLADYVSLGATHIRLVGAYDNDANIISVDDIVSQILYINKENSIIGDVENLKEVTVDLSSTFNLVKNQINGIVDVGNVIWEAGGILSSSGLNTSPADTSSKNRIRSNTISYQDNINISATGDRKFSVYFYNNDTYITGKSVVWVKEVKLADYVSLGATHFRLVGAYDDNRNITDVVDVYSCIVLYNHDSLINDIENLKNDTVLKEATKLSDVGFSVGGINGTTGADYDSDKTRIRTPFIEYDDKMEVFCYNGYKFAVYLYNANGEMIRSVFWLTGKFALSMYSNLGAASFRVAVAYNDNRQITDVNEISQNIVIYTPSRLTKKIFDSSAYDFENCDLPVLYLEGDTSEMTKDNAVTLNYRFKNPLVDYVGDVFAPRKPIIPNITNGLSGTCTCKWQGSSSVRLNYPKRNYTIKLDNDLKIVNPWVSNFDDTITKDWGSHNKFCMKANWIDPSSVRNVVNARLWSQVVATRENINATMQSAPNFGAIDGFPIVIVINGEFEGLYTFNIPKDDWMFGMGNGSNEYLLACEGGSSNACVFRELAVVDGSDFSIEYKPDGVEDSTIVASFNTLIQAVIDADSDWETTVAPYLDIDSVIDYFIFVNCISGHDNLRKNVLYGTYDGTKWFLSAYDLDTTYGANPYGRSFYKVVNARTQFQQSGSIHRLATLMNSHSKDRLKARYQELRNTVLSDENVWYMLTNFANVIPKGIYDLDAKKWSTMPATTTANVENYMNYYRMHCAYLDEEIAAL